ncbi:hypothetical protein AOQ88_00470 [Candidatus Riesia sp. GBBU]|nr:hypothetical protein AOQ88_00470 [Candidatus Riesia sp. GBBU]
MDFSSLFFSNLLLILIRLYKVLISPFLMNRCRFYPTCSQHAINSISRFGIVIGLLLTILQIAKCHPYSKLKKNIQLIKKIKRNREN